MNNQQNSNFHRTFTGTNLSSNRIFTYDLYIDCNTEDGEVHVFLPAISGYGTQIDTIKLVVTDTGKLAATNNIKVFPCPESNDKIENDSVLEISNNGAVISLSIGAGGNWNVEGNASSVSPSVEIWVETTYSALSTLAGSSGLTKGVFYYMTDKRIVLQAISTSQLSNEGELRCRVPNYSVVNPWDAQATYTAGQYAAYGNAVYQAVTPSQGQQPDVVPGDWDLIPDSNNTYYVSEVHFVRYDFANEWIEERRDSRGNVVVFSITRAAQLMVSDNTCETFLWGSDKVYSNELYETFLSLSIYAASANLVFSRNSFKMSDLSNKTRATSFMGVFNNNTFENTSFALINSYEYNFSNNLFKNTTITSISISGTGLTFSFNQFIACSIPNIGISGNSVSCSANIFNEYSVRKLIINSNSSSFNRNTFISVIRFASNDDGIELVANNISFSDNSFLNCIISKLFINAADVQFNNNAFSQSSITADGFTITSYGTIFTGNSFSNSSTSGASISTAGGGDECQFKDNQFINSDYDSFTLNGSATFSNNTFSNSDISSFNLQDGSFFIHNEFFETLLSGLNVGGTLESNYFRYLGGINSSLANPVFALSNCTIDLGGANVSFDLATYLNTYCSTPSPKRFCANYAGSNFPSTLDLDNPSIFSGTTITVPDDIQLGLITGELYLLTTNPSTVTEIVSSVSYKSFTPFKVATSPDSSDDVTLSYTAIGSISNNEIARTAGAGTLTLRRNINDFSIIQYSSNFAYLVENYAVIPS